MLKNFQLHKILLPWFKKNARPMPWRETKDPYKIWISEIMLQQTQVQTVIPYYQKWIARFPDLKTLAAASEGEVMKYWAGLGYYRRARMIHKTAKLLCSPFSSSPRSNGGRTKAGGMPSSVDELLKLPGIGRYTAGAISSIAFDLKAPIVDGNVIRILTRIFGIKDDISKPKAIEKIWQISESLLPEKNTGDFNQSMMELGATVCLPQNPKCGACPVQKNCKAYSLGRQEEFPFKSNREKLEKIKTAALILRNSGKVLLERQPPEGRWGGLWMFPHGKTREEVSKRFKVKESKKTLTVSHGFTKYQVSLEVFETYPHLNPPPNLMGRDGRGLKNCKWISINKLPNFAMPAPHKKIALHLSA